MFFGKFKSNDSRESKLIPMGILMMVLLLGNFTEARAQFTGISDIGHSYQADARGGTETSIGDTGLCTSGNPHLPQPRNSPSLIPRSIQFSSTTNGLISGTQVILM